MWSWGDNTYGQLGHGLVADTARVATVRTLTVKWSKMMLSMQNVLVSHIALGAHHSVAITETGDIFVCGRGDMGQLGLGNCKDCPKMTIVDALQVSKSPM